MVTAQAFFVTNNEVGLDFDHFYGNQCVDLLQFYNQDVLGGAFIPGATALDIWNGPTPPHYTKVLNSTDPENNPKTGDVIFFSFNHVAIVITADDMNIVSFDQNFPTQGYTNDKDDFIGTGVSHFQTHSYGSPVNVLGWWSV